MYYRGVGGGVEGRSEAKFEQQLHICNFIDLDIIGVSASLKYRIRWYKVCAKIREFLLYLISYKTF